MIDRRALVERHDPVLDAADPSVLSIGNGRFAVGFDRLGTQQSAIGTATTADPGAGSPRDLRVNTLAEWAWHSAPDRPDSLWSDQLRRYETPRGAVPYMDLQGPSGPHEDAGDAGWFRANPHRVSLFALRLRDLRTGGVLSESTAEQARQHLALRTGLLTSTSVHSGRPLEVLAAVDPEADALALRIRGGDLVLELVFPYASPAWDEAADFTRPDAHSTQVSGSRVRRRLDDLAYEIAVHGGTPRLIGAGAPSAPECRSGPESRSGAGSPSGAGTRSGAGSSSDAVLGPAGRDAADADLRGHVVRVEPAAPGGELDVVLELLPRDVPGVVFADVVAQRREPSALTGAQVRERSARAWTEFWESTAALDLSASQDPRAEELERRVVLSRFLHRAHAAGTMPPAETGLLMNSWRGRAHLEMHWWHSAHHALWGDAPTLRRMLNFYTTCLPVARATARAQGCRGARWPKQIGSDLRESPSDIGPFLLWQQPHPIHLAELCRRAAPGVRDPELELLVEESALFLVDMLRRDPTGTAAHDLATTHPAATDLGVGPPIIGAQERHVEDRYRLRDPAFELAYVAWALRIADAWRVRRGDPEAGQWSRIAERIHSPLSADGALRTFRDGPPMARSDHPAHLLAFGMVPPSSAVPEKAATAALADVLQEWDWPSTWGWDAPAAAMTATRLQRPDQAVDLLLMDTEKYRFDAAGHCFQRETLPDYLPANGALLAAVGLMAGGWDGGPATPGLPAAWHARVEGMLPSPGPLG